MHKATYKIIHFTNVNRYVGVAWNFSRAVLISTSDLGSYTEARDALVEACTTRGVNARYFDGLYTCDGSQNLCEVR